MIAITVMKGTASYEYLYTCLIRLTSMVSFLKWNRHSNFLDWLLLKWRQTSCSVRLCEQAKKVVIFKEVASSGCDVRMSVMRAGTRNFFPDEQTVSDRGVRSEGERKK